MTWPTFGPTINAGTLAGLEKSSDWPRVNLYKARWGVPIVSGIPKWYAESGSGNHKLEFIAASVLQDGMEPWLSEVLEWLDALLAQHNVAEQLSAIYDTYYLASVCVFDHCAARDGGFPEVRERCRRYFQATVNLWSALRDSRGRVVAPGKRTSPEGWDERRDQCLRMLLGEGPKRRPQRWWDAHPHMETGLVAQLAQFAGWSFKPSSAPVRLMDPVTITYVKGGHIAESTFTKCHGFPTWRAWSIGGRMGSVSWKDVRPAIPSRRAKGMGPGSILMAPDAAARTPDAKALRTVVIG